MTFAIWWRIKIIAIYDWILREARDSDDFSYAEYRKMEREVNTKRGRSAEELKTLKGKL